LFHVSTMCGVVRLTATIVIYFLNSFFRSSPTFRFRWSHIDTNGKRWVHFSIEMPLQFFSLFCPAYKLINWNYPLLARETVTNNYFCSTWLNIILFKTFLLYFNLIQYQNNNYFFFFFWYCLNLKWVLGKKCFKIWLFQ